MGALLTRLYGIDQATPYGFKFSGITLWLLAADAGVQRVIDNFNPNCPRWCDSASVDVPSKCRPSRHRRVSFTQARAQHAAIRHADWGVGRATTLR